MSEVLPIFNVIHFSLYFPISLQRDGDGLDWLFARNSTNSVTRGCIEHLPQLAFSNVFFLDRGELNLTVNVQSHFYQGIKFPQSLTEYLLQNKWR